MNPWSTKPKYSREETRSHEMRGLARSPEKKPWRPDHFRMIAGEDKGNQFGVDMNNAISESGTRPTRVIHLERKRCAGGTTQVIEKDIMDMRTYRAAIRMGLSVTQATTYATRAIK